MKAEDKDAKAFDHQQRDVKVELPLALGTGSRRATQQSGVVDQKQIRDAVSKVLQGYDLKPVPAATK
mgnify:CR=1 FL=1